MAQNRPWPQELQRSQARRNFILTGAPAFRIITPTQSGQRLVTKRVHCQVLAGEQREASSPRRSHLYLPRCTSSARAAANPACDCASAHPPATIDCMSRAASTLFRIVKHIEAFYPSLAVVRRVDDAPEATDFAASGGTIFCNRDLLRYAQLISSESFKPSSRNANFVSSTFWVETPSAGATSTRSVSLRPEVAANFDSTFV